MADILDENQVPSIGPDPEKKTNEPRFFVTDVAKLLTGTSLAQVITFVVSPIISRLYLPEFFGVTQVFTSITSILSVVASLRYELAIMLPKKDEEAANMLSVSLILSLLTSSITIPVIWFWGRDIAALFNSPELASYLWMVPPTTFLIAAFSALNYWNSRNRKYVRLSIARINQEVVIDGLRLALGFSGQASSGSLISSNLAGNITSTGTLAVQIWKDDHQLFRRSLNWREMLDGIKRYKKFPLYSLWAAILNNLSLQLPAFLLSAFFSSTVTGYYGMGNRILRLPVQLISAAIGQVFFQRAARAKLEGTLGNLVHSTVKRLISFGMFPMLLMTLAGREIFIIFLGGKWAEAVVYTQLLGVWTFFIFISSPISNLTSILERQEISLGFNLVVFITRAVSLLIGGFVGDARFALILFTISGILTYGWFSLWVTTTSGVPLRRTLLELGGNLAFCSPFLLIVGLAKWGFNLSDLWVTVISALMGVFYYALVVYKDRTLWTAMLSILQRYHIFTSGNQR